MDQSRIHGGSIPRWQSRLGEGSCSYPIWSSEADGNISPARRGGGGGVRSTTWGALLIDCAGRDYPFNGQSSTMPLESMSVMRWRFPGVAII